MDRATGGKGRRAVLTRYGQRLIQLYDLLAQIQQKAFDVLSDDDALPLDSLLAAISRFSCRPAPATSGSAPLPAAIAMPVQQHVEVLLADGKTRLNVAITAQSAERSWDSMRAGRCWSCSKRHGSASPSIPQQPARPITSCRDVISHIECGSGQCEVLMTLADGQTLCATLPRRAGRWPGGRNGGDRLLQCRSHHSRDVMLTRDITRLKSYP